ncbi:tetratricopeptide repeat protein [Reichenbachiella versicolor]|uniref:tetratricopeptide repeat protein n=1 Tax=Reichenbachiella versicolor TaxID=1821036 RepID=UPI000D6DD3D1|nr:tetratricopeptide repeat protein [Reichenbachiella versicolor]
MRKVILPLVLFMSILISCQKGEISKGDKFFGQKNYKEAIVAYTEYLKLHPNHIQSLYNRGRSYEELHQNDKAEKDFLEVIEVDKKNTSARLSLAELKYKAKDFEKARFYAEEAVKLKDDLATAHFWLGRAYHQLGEFDEAMKGYNDAIALDPNLGNAFLNRGAIKITKGSKSSGCEDLQKAQSLGVGSATKAIERYCN